MANNTSFRLYRYQLLPIDRHSDDLWDSRTVEELLADKNSIFARSIPSVGDYRHRGAELSVQVDKSGEEAFVVRLAPGRFLTRETADFRSEQIEHWPHVSAIILNRPDEQYLVVQERQAAFASTDTVIKVIEKATRGALESAGLRLRVEAMFKESYFWSLVSEFHHRITSVEFEFITPNMANISGSLSASLKGLSKETNASKSELALQSDADSALKLSEENSMVKGLVEYTSEGGGDITIKVRGLRKKFHTRNSPREIHIGDLELSGPAEQVAKIVRSLIS